VRWLGVVGIALWRGRGFSFGHILFVVWMNK
jgi:hypothetical protein